MQLRNPLAGLVVAALAPALLAQDVSNAEPITLSEFVVDASTDRGYVATNATSASRIPVPLRDLPLNVSVLNSQFMQDLAPRDLNEALRYATGARKAFETETAYFLRGQRINYQLRNGFARYDFTPAANIERVEVVKGPAAILYGLTFPGGVINYITKRPQARTFLEVNAEAGNYDLRGASLDANVAVLPSGRLATRLIASASEGGSFVPNNPNRYQTLSPSVLFKPTERTTVIVEYDYANKLDNNWAFGRPRIIPNVANRFGTDVLPANASPGDGFKEQDSSAFAFEVEQKLTDTFTARLIYNYSAREETEIKYGAAAANPMTLVSPANIYVNNFRNWDENYQAELVGRISTGPLEHRLLAGAQVFQREFSRRQRNPLPGIRQDYTILTIPPIPSTTFFDDSVWAPISYTGSSVNEITGFYLVDTISLLEGRLNLLGALRRTEIEQGDPRAGTTDLTQDRTSPQLGANYRVTNALSVFALTSESLQPNGQNTNPVGFGPQGAFDPQLGERYDIGVKFEFFNQRISGSASYFDIARTNVPQVDPVLTAQFQATGGTGQVRILSGEETTRGFELELALSPTPDWQVILGYQYIGFAEITDDSNPARIGTPLENIADTQFNLWTKYALNEQFSFGGGFTSIGAFDAQGVTYESTTQTDLFAQYRTKLFGRTTLLRLNVYNVFDEENQTQVGVFSEPLRIQGSITVRF